MIWKSYSTDSMYDELLSFSFSDEKMFYIKQNLNSQNIDDR